MKLIRKGAAGKMVLIGVDSKTAKWYAIGKSVEKYIPQYNIDDDITIKSENINGKDVLTFIQKGNGAISTADTSSTKTDTGSSYKPTPNPRELTNQPAKTYSYGESPEEQNTIKRQAIMHATSRSLVSLQGFINLDNIEAVSERLYKHYERLVG